MTATRNIPGSIENIALAALSSVQTCRSTYAVCRQALEEGIPGDMVECGVYAGAQAAIMAKAIVDDYDGAWEYLFPRTFPHVHLFDSFERISEPTERDTEYIASGHRKGTASCTLEGVKSNMKQWGIPEELLVYHVGWFKDTVPPFHGMPMVGRAPAHNSIAVLRLDADLYDSTMICMEHFYHLISPGGFLIVDDYGLTEHGKR